MKSNNYGRQYFQFEERINPKTKTKCVVLKDKSNVIWGWFSNYRMAKIGIEILVQKYEDILQERSKRG
jgi:hypothetical protein